MPWCVGRVLWGAVACVVGVSSAGDGDGVELAGGGGVANGVTEWKASVAIRTAW